MEIAFKIPAWLLWVVGVPVGVVLFWFCFLGVCFWWVWLRNR